MRYEFMRFVVLVLATAGILATPRRADAGFMTQTLGYEYFFPDISTPIDNSTFVVAAGVERSSLYSGNAGTDVASMDVSDGSIVVQFYVTSFGVSASFNGFHLYDISSTVPAITGVTINSATNMTGFNATRVNFDANNIFANFESLPVDTTTIVQLDVTFAGTVATPLPPTLLAGFLGMGLLAGVRRFRRA